MRATRLLPKSFLLFGISVACLAQTTDWQRQLPPPGVSTINPVFTLALQKPFEPINLAAEIGVAYAQTIDLPATSLQSVDATRELVRKLLVEKMSFKAALASNSVVILHLVAWV